MAAGEHSAEYTGTVADLGLYDMLQHVLYLLKLGNIPDTKSPID